MIDFVFYYCCPLKTIAARGTNWSQRHTVSFLGLIMVTNGVLQYRQGRIIIRTIGMRIHSQIIPLI